MQTLHTGKIVGSNPTAATMTTIYVVQSRFDSWCKLPWVAIFEDEKDAYALVDRMFGSMDPYYRENFPSWIWVEPVTLDHYHRHAERYKI